MVRSLTGWSEMAFSPESAFRALDRSSLHQSPRAGLARIPGVIALISIARDFSAANALVSMECFPDRDSHCSVPCHLRLDIEFGIPLR